MIDRALEQAWVYKLSQWFWYRPGEQQAYATNWIRARPGDRILDFGCGPAVLLGYLPPVRYMGYDPNPHYIEDAKKRFAGRGEFVCGYWTELAPGQAGAFDVVLANGVVHHLTDEQAQRMFELAAQALKPGGRIVTRDGCFEETQSAFARFLLRSDRGKFVRTVDGYRSLMKKHFEIKRMEILRDALRLPYSFLHCEGVKAG